MRPEGPRVITMQRFEGCLSDRDDRYLEKGGVVKLH